MPKVKLAADWWKCKAGEEVDVCLETAEELKKEGIIDIPKKSKKKAKKEADKLIN